MQYAKAKSVSKQVLSRGKELRTLILQTMKTCSEIVGGTLGPGGMPVVIERQEDSLPPMITKDGVTVFRNLGFDDSTSQVIMEAARDASIRTAEEAGDGTTTATILSEALVRNTMNFCDRQPKMSPQRVVRAINRAFSEIIEPWIVKNTIKTTIGTEDGKKNLHAVAKVSANGDTALADAVIKCFELTGDEGNVTLVEATGTEGYEVEKIDGYPIPKGYEHSCGKFYQIFINDPSRQMLSLSKPNYILYHGKVNDIYSFLPIFEKIDAAAQAGTLGPNVVFVATGFSEVVIAHLATNFKHSNTINVYPVVAPLSQSQTAQYDFLMDLSYLTGGTLFDPMNNPVENAEVSQLGLTEGFEAGRNRSSVLGYRDELLIIERVEDLKKQVDAEASVLYKTLLQERIGKISGGIAKLKVVGSSFGELREKKDRAEDAICAVRGAIKHGALFAGGWGLVQLRNQIVNMASKNFSELEVSAVKEVLGDALLEPVNRLFVNAGYTLLDAKNAVDEMSKNTSIIFDVLNGKFVDPMQEGLLDSSPAVKEAIKNSISIATLLGTCGGTVVFKRDTNVERQEARDTAEFLRNSTINEADARA